MVKNFNHQKTIGLIGATPDAHEFILQANKLGFTTFLLCEEDTQGKDHFGADQVFTGSVEDEENIQNFLMGSDFIVYFDYSLTEEQLEIIQNTAVVPQGDELLGISEDRVLQKAFKESLGIHISPYETIVKPEDIESSIRSIGYPAVLKSNYLDTRDNQQSFYIYDEEDIEKAEELVEYGTYVLESWVTPKKQYSLSLVKNHAGTIEFFPIVEKKYREDKLTSVQLVPELEEELKNEIKRVATVLAENIQFQGAISIDFILSPADTLYVGRIYPFPTAHSRYTAEFTTLSVVEAHLRAIVSLPIPDVKEDLAPLLWRSFTFADKEAIRDLMSVQPNWFFTFYPLAKDNQIASDQVAGHIIVKTNDIDRALKFLKDYQL